MEASYLASTKEALDYFQVSENNGLSDSQVEKAIQQYGRNGMPHSAKHRPEKPLTYCFSSPRRSAYAIVEACA